MYEKGEREYQIPEEFRKYGMLLARAKTSRIKSLAVAVLKDETVRVVGKCLLVFKAAIMIFINGHTFVPLKIFISMLMGRTAPYSCNDSIN